MGRVLAALLLICAATGAPRHVRPTTARPSPVHFDIDATNNAATTNPIKPGDSGPAVLRAQVLLDRAHFSVGEIDGAYGDNMLNAVKSYQSAHNLPADGVVSPDTWKALDTDTLPVIVPYAISDKDVAGPFYKIPSDMMKEAKLPALGYSSPAEELGERFHASPKLLATLNRGTSLDKAGVQIMVPNVDRAPITDQAARVLVAKDCSCLEVFDAENHLIAHYPATMGSEHDPLPIGDWKLSKPLWNPVFHYNPDLFWNASEKDSKATIKPGPNNPVGVVWIGLSKPHYGIHGTPEPSQIGKTQSHGCIRLTNWDATELAMMVKPGMTASLRDSPPDNVQAAETADRSIDPPGSFAEDYAELMDRDMTSPIAGVKAAQIQDTFNNARPGGKRHEATDIMEPRGTPVHAIQDGVIQKLFLSRFGGNTIYEFDPQGTYCFYYAHLDHYAPALHEGMAVKKGDVIGFVGSTGDASPNAPHLHFAIFKLGPEKQWWKGTAIDPYPILTKLASQS